MSWLKRYREILVGLAFAPIGMVVGYGIGKVIKLEKGTLPDFGIWLIVALAVNSFLVIAWHELGHVLGGLLVGFRFYLYAVGPLRVDRGPAGLEWKFNRNLSLWGGIAAAAPDPEKANSLSDLRPKMFSLVAGGPVASLLGALLLWPAMQSWRTDPWFAMVTGTFGILSILIFFATMLPVKTGGYMSDGSRILHLLAGTAASDRWMTSVMISTNALAIRPREWPEEWMEAITKDVSEDYDGIMALWLRYSWHSDREEHQAALYWLEKALAAVDKWPEAARPIVYQSAADYYARVEKDPVRAREFFNQANRPGFVAPPLLALSEAGVLAVEGRKDEAQGAIERALPALELVSGSSRQALQESIDELRAGLN